MIDFPLPLLGFAAYSGTGKTTLLSKLIPLLKIKGIRVGVVKHAHHDIDIDHPKKDSYVLRESGATKIVVASRKRTAIIIEHADNEAEPTLDDALKNIHTKDLDLILVEGFKLADLPKIELHRVALDKPYLYPEDNNIIAIALDHKLNAENSPLQLDLNQPQKIADFIEQENTERNIIIMKKQSSCADPFEADAISVDEARSRIFKEIAPIKDSEKLALRACLNRYLAEDVYSPIDVPSHTNSAMDGYAIAGDDLPTQTVQDYQVVGTSYAGRPSTQPYKAGQVVRIMTGGVMPAGTDTVIMQEQIEIIDKTHVLIKPEHEKHQNVRQTGEDIKKGCLVLSKGRQITPADLGILASLGIGEISVYRRPRVTFFSTGDELRSVGETLAEGEIYDSNRYTLFGMLKQQGAEITDMGVVQDTQEAIHAAFVIASQDADIVITSGGVFRRRSRLYKAYTQSIRRHTLLENRYETRTAINLRHSQQSI